MTRQAQIEYLQIIEEEIKRNKRNQLKRLYDGAYDWQRKFIAATKEFSSCMLMAANRCVAGHTSIQVRQGKEIFSAPFVEILSEPDVNIRYWADGSLHDTDTFSAYFQGILPTFRLYLSNGQFLDCTDGHKVLDVEGNYRTIQDLMSDASALRCYQISEDYQASCVGGDCQHDQPLLRKLDNGQALPPLSSDAQQHSSLHRRSFLLSDEAGHIDQYNQAFQGVDLLSNQGALTHVLGLCGTFSSYVFLPTSELLIQARQIAQKLRAEEASDLQLDNEDDSRRISDYCEAYSNHIFYSKPVSLTGRVDIIAWEGIGLQPCFDLSMPDHHNYVTSGIVSHNCGKTRTGLVVDSYHLRGDYPDDWEGIEFDHPPLCWLLGYTGEKTRDLLQNKLFGRLENGKFAGGLIPSDLIVDYKSMAGTSGAMREVRVKHVLGVSICQFWSYKQGQDALMGDEVDFVHIDEEPEDPEIFPQVLTRTLTGGNKDENGDPLGGHVMLTFTPEHGKTQLVCKFMGEEYEADEEEDVVEYKDSGMYMQNATWDECPHLNEDAKRKILSQYPAYQRKMRSKGVPLMGSGLIYEVDEDEIKCEPFDVPDHWFVINGMDLGWDHPQAHIQMVWNRDADIFYIINAWRARKKQPFEAWHNVKVWAENVPTSWPADGLMTEKGSAKQQKDYYEEEGFNMLPEHATWEGGGNGVWAGLVEINDLFKTGRMKIASPLHEVFEEIRQYHTKTNSKGKSDIVKIKDDYCDAIRYAYMMRRYAIRVMDLYQDNHQYQRNVNDSSRDVRDGY